MDAGVDEEDPRVRVGSPLSPRQVLRRAFAATLPRRYFMVSGPAASRAVCLTFDDGPHPEHTPAVLDALRAARARATFFVVGENAARHPELVRRIVDEGHALGHHSYTHGRPELTSADVLLGEVRRTLDLLTMFASEPVRLFRPPHGKLTVGKALGLWRDGQTVVLWNQDPKDFARRSADETRAWFGAHALRGGDIVLLHDVHAHAAPALPSVIESVRRADLRLGTPLEWIDDAAA